MIENVRTLVNEDFNLKFLSFLKIFKKKQDTFLNIQ
jgi:hypothetical protein